MTSHGQCPRGGACECPRVFQIDDVTRTMSKGGGVRLVFHPSKFRPPPPGWLATGLRRDHPDVNFTSLANLFSYQNAANLCSIVESIHVFNDLLNNILFSTTSESLPSMFVCALGPELSPCSVLLGVFLSIKNYY